MVEPGALDWLAREVERGTFYEREHEGIATESCLKPNRAFDLLHFLVNNRRVFDFVEAVTGCERIGSFNGRIFRLAAGLGHYDSWHDDIDGNRLVALSLNLSPQPYRGGILQLRRKEDEASRLDIPNPRFGDAVLFCLSDELEHRVTNVEGPVPRTTFAGWFRKQPTYGWYLQDSASDTQGGKPQPVLRPLAEDTPASSGVDEGVISPQARLVLADGAAYQDTGHGVVLFSPLTGHGEGLDTVGSRAWTLLMESGTLDAVEWVMADEYDVEPSVLQRDLLRLASHWRRHGIIQVAGQ